MDLHLKDKVIVITGGAKGIGAAITRAAVDEAAIPVVVDRDEQALQQIDPTCRFAPAGPASTQS